MEKRPLDLERLLAHAGWVRSLARSLVHDPAAAEDLAQETLAVALDRAPGTERGLRPWLGAVARKLALRGRRDRARLARRHEAAAREGEEPSAAERAADAELRALVGEAVADLDEPYRSTVMLRYFGDLSSAEIARRERVPEATVRSRLKRGLDRLRTDLDRRHGGREAWCGAVLRLLSPESALVGGASGAAVVEGVLAMKIVLGSVAAAAVIAAGLVGMWQLGSREAESAPAGPVSARPAAAPEVASPGDIEPEELAAAEPREERRTAAVAPTEPAAPVEAAEAEPTPIASLEARIVDDGGHALPGAKMELDLGSAARGMLMGLGSLSAAAGADGGARLERPLPNGDETVNVRFSHPHLATRFVRTRLSAGETAHLGEVRLGPAGSIEGRVEDGNGAPLAGARVFATGLDDLREDPEELRRHGPFLAQPVVETESDGAGRFRLEGIPAGFLKVWANAEDRGYVSEGPYEIAPDDVLRDVVLALPELESGDVIAGIVLSPDREPVGGARMSYSYRFGNTSSSSSVVSEADGTFSLRLAHRVPYHFRVMDSQDRWPAVLVPEVQPGTRGLEVLFEETREVEVAVIDQTGEPVEEFGLEARAAESADVPGIARGALAFVGSGKHADGVARLRLPSQAFNLSVDAGGYEHETIGPLAPEEVGERIEVRLTALPGVHGRVLAGGEPVAGAEVALHSTVDDGTLHVVNGFRCSTDPYARSTSRTDEEGRFHVYPRHDGEYVLRVDQPGYAPAELGPLRIETARAVDGLELRLGQGGTIEGRVLLSGGEDPTGVVLGLNHGDGKARTLRAGPDGRYRFEGLAVGLWELTREEAELSPEHSSSSLGNNPGGDPPTWSCEVFEGQTTYFDLDLREKDAATLRGTLAVEGDSPAGWSASLRYTEWFNDQVLSSTLTDDAGAFELTAPSSGTYALVLRSPHGLEVETTVELGEGETAWAHALALASVDGAGAEGLADDPTVEYVAEGTTLAGADLHARAVVRADAEGRFQLPHILAGQGKIHRYKGQPGSAWAWIVLAEIDAAAGEQLAVTLEQ
ncbi:MAG: sigma-70 family RNA polymerase sigma factor [Planctomycetota bacterium]